MKKISRRSFLAAAGVSAAALALTACGGSGSTAASTAASTGASSAAGTAAGGTLNIMLETEVQSLDPQIATDGTSFEVIADYTDGLMQMDADGAAVPALAETYDISEDGKTYTFHLRDGMKWSDDQPVTAQNYVDSWLRLVNPDLAFSYAFLAYGIVGAEDYCENGGKVEDVAVELVDDLTFKATLVAPDPAFIKKVGMVCFYPIRKDLIDAAGDANWTNDYTLHVFNGPFYISDRVLENNMTLKKNEKYWNADEVTLTQINLRVVDETSTQAQLMESQQIDLLTLTDYEYVDLWESKVQDGTFQHISMPMTP